MMHTIDGARCFQAMVPMRDGVRLNTFVYLPQLGGPRFPVILHRTPYGITVPQGQRLPTARRAGSRSARSPARRDLAGLARDRASRLCRGLSGLSRTLRLRG